MAPNNNTHSDPTIDAVAATAGLAINVTWGGGPRAGITEEIDLSPILKAMKYFRPLREDPALFATAHPILQGIGIAWGDDEEIDLSADAILRLAHEKMTSEDMRAFIERQGLTETALAAMLDYSRRQIVGFLNENRPIPRVVSLACHYIEMINPTSDDQDVDDDDDMMEDLSLYPIYRLAPDQTSPVSSSSTGPLADQSFHDVVITSTQTAHRDNANVH